MHASTLSFKICEKSTMNKDITQLDPGPWNLDPSILVCNFWKIWVMFILIWGEVTFLVFYKPKYTRVTFNIYFSYELVKNEIVTYYQTVMWLRSYLLLIQQCGWWEVRSHSTTMTWPISLSFSHQPCVEWCSRINHRISTS
jgi:hypothetical protein